jgi:hypothetical protein
MTIYKAPFEQFSVSLDFAADIGAGNGIASITAVTAVSSLTGLDSTEEVLAPSPEPAIANGAGANTAVAFTVQGGVVGERHTVSVQIVSSICEKYQGDVTLEIVE